MAAKSAETTTKRQVPAVTRAIALLRFLARSDAPVGFTPTACAPALVPSPCLTILQVAQDWGHA